MRTFIALLIPMFLAGCEYNEEGHYDAHTPPERYYEGGGMAVNSEMTTYFPLRQGESWTYGGSGNEYAAFSRQVIARDGNEVHVRESNAGAIIDKVYRVDDRAVTLVYSAEGYDAKSPLRMRANRDQVILQSPLLAGNQWSNGDEIRRVVNTSARVETPGGIYENCLEIEARVAGTNATTTELYASGIGLVQRVFQSGDSTVFSYLQQHQ